MIEQAVYQKLRDDAGVSALINGRIFFGHAPKDVAPSFLVMDVLNTQDTYSVDGADPFRIKRFHFCSYAGKYTDALTLSNTVRSLLKSFRGTLPDGTSVNGCIVTKDEDAGYAAGEGTTGYVFERLLEVEFQHADFS